MLTYSRSEKQYGNLEGNEKSVLKNPTFPHSNEFHKMTYFNSRWQKKDIQSVGLTIFHGNCLTSSRSTKRTVIRFNRLLITIKPLLFVLVKIFDVKSTGQCQYIIRSFSIWWKMQLCYVELNSNRTLTKGKSSEKLNGLQCLVYVLCTRSLVLQVLSYIWKLKFFRENLMKMNFVDKGYHRQTSREYTINNDNVWIFKSIK